MKVLMISTDSTLLGQKGIGDAIARHKEYARGVERLDILVLSKKKVEGNKIAQNCLAEPIYFWRHKSRAVEFFKRQNYNLIVCQDPFITGSLGVFLKKKFKVKLIIHFHGDFFDNSYWLKENFRHRIYKKMAQKNIKYADSIRVVSEGIRQKLIKRGIASENIYKIATPVNLEQFFSTPDSTWPNNKIILTVGRIVKAKDFTTLIKAAKEVCQSISDFEWQIIGEGPLLKKFKKQTQNQPYIKWLVGVNHQDLVNYYKKANFIVITSNNESFGKVFLEAAMSKKPAISTATVGAEEIIKDGESGYIVPIGDYKRIAARAIYLLNNEQVAQQMGQRAYEIVNQKFGWQKNIDLIMSMWRQTVGGNL